MLFLLVQHHHIQNGFLLSFCNIVLRLLFSLRGLYLSAVLGNFPWGNLPRANTAGPFVLTSGSATACSMIYGVLLSIMFSVRRHSFETAAVYLFALVRRTVYWKQTKTASLLKLAVLSSGQQVIACMTCMSGVHCRRESRPTSAMLSTENEDGTLLRNLAYGNRQQ